MNEQNKDLQNNLMDLETKYIINKTDNKNSYCVYREGVFVVNLGKHHDEKEAKKLISELKEKILNNGPLKEPLEINTVKKTFRLFGDLHRYDVLSETREIKIFNSSNKLVSTIKIRVIEDNFIKNKIETSFIMGELFTKLTYLQTKWEQKLGLKKHKISIIKKTSSWGSNSLKTGNITYSLSMHNFSVEIIESLVIHELAHDLYPNHSKEFFKYVNKHCPNYEELHWKNQKHIFK